MIQQLKAFALRSLQWGRGLAAHKRHL